jgi:hypothetical protein
MNKLQAFFTIGLILLINPVSTSAQNNECVTLPTGLEVCRAYRGGKLRSVTQNKFEVNGRQVNKSVWESHTKKICDRSAIYDKFKKGVLYTTYIYSCND